jgi:hypothetical protein
MTAPAYAVSHGRMVREVEPADSVRLEQLRLKALRLGFEHSDIFQMEDGPHLGVDVYEGTRHLGTLLCYFEGGEERWRIQASCSIDGLLLPQADWLIEGAKRVHAAFLALVTP